MFGIDVNHLLQTWGYAAIVLFIFVEDFGIPSPGETVLIAGAVEAGQGNLNIFLVALFAFAAAVAGDNVGYAIGHYGGRRLILGLGCRVHLGGHYLVTPQRLDHAQSFFDHYGGWVIVIARFVEGFRQLNGIVAGTLHYGWKRFLPLNALGAALWVAFWTTAAYFASDWVSRLHGTYRWALVGGGIALFLVIGLAAYVMGRRLGDSA